MIDPQLDERIRAVLAAMAVLMESGGTSFTVAARIKPHGESQQPEGVRFNLRVDRPPPKDRSLHDFYAFHFAGAKTDEHRRLLLYLAEADLAHYRRGAPAGATAFGHHPDQDAGEKRDERILAWYEGVHCLEASVLESTHGGYCPEENVRRVRERDRRNPEDGRKWPGWRGWSDEQRVKEINRLHFRDVSIREIADRLHTSKRAVERYLGGYRRKAA